MNTVEYLPHAITNLYAAADAIVAVCIAILGIIIYVGRRAPSALAFAGISAAMFVWSLSASQMYSVDTPAALLAWVRLNYFAGVTIMAAYYIYALAVPARPLPWTKIGASLAALGALAYVYLGTSLIVTSTTIHSLAPLDRTWELGDYSWVALMSAIAFFALGANEMYQNFRNHMLSTSDDRYPERVQIFNMQCGEWHRPHSWPFCFLILAYFRSTGSDQSSSSHGSRSSSMRYSVTNSFQFDFTLSK